MKKQKIKIKVILWYFVRKSLFQWGQWSGSGGLKAVTITLPIRVTQIYSAVGASGTPIATLDLNSGAVGNFTQTSFVMTVDGPIGYWLCDCI